MAAPAPSRVDTAIPPRADDIEIPDRPAIASFTLPDPARRTRVILYGGIAAAALLAVIMISLLWSARRDEIARAPADAPLIKAEHEPFRVPPERPGGMDVPNRDILVYERMHGGTGSRPAVERLMPEPEQPLAPPMTSPRPTRPASESSPPAVDSPHDSGPPGIEHSPVSSPAAKASSAASSSPGSLATKSSAASANKSAAQSQLAQAKVPTAPATAANPVQPGKPAKGSSIQVQLLSSRSAEEAKRAWARLKDKNGDVLGTLSPAVARGDLGDRGIFYRLRAGPVADEAKAKAICDSLAGRGVSCIVVRSSQQGG